MTAPCSAPNCERPVKSLELCAKHYQRFKKRDGDISDRPYDYGTDTDRFWRKVEKAGNDECWHWATKKGLNAYGQFKSKELGPVGAHRFSFYLAHGFLPKETMHLCDVRSCVNPAHLKAGTRSENMHDMFAKGRGNRAPMPQGEKHHNAKFTADDIRAIRSSGETAGALGRHYGVALQTIRSIQLRKTWKHIT